MNTAKCACLHVRYDPIKHPNGSYSAEWKCKSCGAKFIRKLEKESAIEILRNDFRRLTGFHWFWIGFFFCFFLIGFITFMAKV